MTQLQARSSNCVITQLLIILCVAFNNLLNHSKKDRVEVSTSVTPSFMPSCIPTELKSEIKSDSFTHSHTTDIEVALWAKAKSDYPAGTICWHNVDPMLVHRLRRWPNIGSTLDQHWANVLCLLGTSVYQSSYRDIYLWETDRTY